MDQGKAFTIKTKAAPKTYSKIIALNKITQVEEQNVSPSLSPTVADISPSISKEKSEQNSNLSPTERVVAWSPSTEPTESTEPKSSDSGEDGLSIAPSPTDIIIAKAEASPSSSITTNPSSTVTSSKVGKSLPKTGNVIYSLVLFFTAGLIIFFSLVF